MSRRTITTFTAAALLTIAIAGCGGSTASAAPGAASPAAASPAAASPAAPAGSCTDTTQAGTVAVSIKDFAFAPAAITAKVGDTVTFTNDDTTAHTATLDDGSCATKNIDPGTAHGLTFTAAGTYPFHCAIHKTMTGTITVS